MTSKYSNLKTFLQNEDCQLLTTEEDFNKSQNFTFQCSEDHQITMGYFSFNNKRGKLLRERKSGTTDGHICKYCFFFNKNKKEIFDKTGHILVSMKHATENGSNNCTYICGNCGELKTSSTNNLKKDHNTGFCSSCFERDKKDLEQVNKELKATGIKYTCIEYKNSYNMVMKCDCGNIFTTRRNYLNRGRGCNKCYRDRTEQTNLERYGCKNVMHNTEVFIKSQKRNTYKKKEYTFPKSGKKITIQGYEPYCIDELIEIHQIDENRICVDDSQMPKFMYTFNGTLHRYYPDIMIYNEENVIMKFIEVKSVYTFLKDEDKNKAKWDCVRKMGFDLDVMIYNEKGIQIQLEFVQSNNNINPVTLNTLDDVYECKKIDPEISLPNPKKVPVNAQRVHVKNIETGDEFECKSIVELSSRINLTEKSTRQRIKNWNGKEFKGLIITKL